MTLTTSSIPISSRSRVAGWQTPGSTSSCFLMRSETTQPVNSSRIAFSLPDDVSSDARSYTIREQINPFCGLYRREAYMRAGGYDEDPLVLYNEDVAMHIRLAFAGLTFAAESEISIINHRRLNSMSASSRLKCLQAHYHVMRKTAAREGADRYAAEIARKLWVAAGGLAAELDWRTADQAAALAMQLAGPSVGAVGTGFQGALPFLAAPRSSHSGRADPRVQAAPAARQSRLVRSVPETSLQSDHGCHLKKAIDIA